MMLVKYLLSLTAILITSVVFSSKTLAACTSVRVTNSAVFVLVINSPSDSTCNTSGVSQNLSCHLSCDSWKFWNCKSICHKDFDIKNNGDVVLNSLTGVGGGSECTVNVGKIPPMWT